MNQVTGTALVVDDDGEFRLFVANTLEKAGFSVIEASNGLEAIALNRTFNPDVIVSDIYMPHEDGFGVLLAAKRQNQDAKVILMSGGARTFADYDALRAARNLGAHAVLSKPFTPYELVQTVTDRPIVN